MLGISYVVGAVAGAVVVVVVPKAYAWVKKQVTSVKADVSAGVSKVETSAKVAVATAAADVVKKV